MTTKQTNQLEIKKETLPVVEALNYGEYAEAGTGFEDVSSKDLAVPFLKVLQPGSPEVDDTSKGARPGQIFNTVTGELISGETGVVFIPCHNLHCYVEWVSREKGGGYVGQRDRDSLEIKKLINAKKDIKDKLFSPQGNELIETGYLYGLLLNEAGTESTGFAVISFTSTKLNAYRKLITATYALKGRPPLFANRAVFKTVKQKNEKGTFFNFEVEPLKKTWHESLIHPVNEAELLREAVDFRKMVVSGMAKADFNKQDVSEIVESDVEDAAPVADVKSGKAPF